MTTKLSNAVPRLRGGGVAFFLPPLVLGLAVLGWVFSGVAQAQDTAGSPSGNGIQPVVVEDNPSCLDIGYGFGFKIESDFDREGIPMDGTAAGTVLTGDAPEDPVNTVTVSSSDNLYFDWSSTLGMDAVIVKGGDNANVYIYSPEATGDTALHSPINPNNGEPREISHIEFCYDYELTATKTAVAEYTRTYTWEITKSVVPDSHEGWFGDEFTSSYDVLVDQTVTDSDFQVAGDIVVSNPTPFEATFTVSDSVNGTQAQVTCSDGYTLAAGTSTTCTYVADLGDTQPQDGTNTATVASETAAVEGATATADYAFGDPTTVVGYPDINVSDTQPDSGAPWTASGDDSWQYTGNFECPTDESLYTDGVYTFSVPNTATIDETGQSADQNVDVTCYLPASARVVKTTTEGGEDIGQFPFTFELYDPNGNLVESQTLGTGGGEIGFAAELETEGTWTVQEVLPDGWVSTTPLTCTFDVAFPGSAGLTYPCTFDNVEKSRVDLLKLTNGVETTIQTWNFAIYEGPDGFDGTLVASDSTPPALLDFGNVDLNPLAAYTLCELEVPAGYSSFWQIDTDGDGIGDTTLVPYNPNANDDPPEDLGNRCIDINVDGDDEDSEVDIPLVPGTTLHFVVDNQQPGGAPRTPGYWKNWNRCTGGGQQYTADANGGWEEGFWLLEDVLDPAIGGGIVWDDILDDDFTFTIDSCKVAVDILDKREVSDPEIVGDGKKAARDPLHNLATHLLAAQLNFGAGACTTPEVLDAALDAEGLLDKYDFDGDGYYDPDTGKPTTLKKNSDDGGFANELADYLDRYNNGEFCGDGIE